MQKLKKWQRKAALRKGKRLGPTAKAVAGGKKLSPWFTSKRDKRDVRIGNICPLKSAVVNRILRGGKKPIAEAKPTKYILRKLSDRS